MILCVLCGELGGAALTTKTQRAQRISEAEIMNRIGWLCFVFLFLTSAQYRPAPDNLKAREWFQDAKFGLFVHWGVYSVLEDGEWVMNNKKIAVEEYEKLPPRFNPI